VRLITILMTGVKRIVYSILLCGCLNRLHYWSCHFVRLSVRLSRTSI